MQLYSKNEFIDCVLNACVDYGLVYAVRRKIDDQIYGRFMHGATPWSLVNTWIGHKGTLMHTLDIADNLPLELKIEIHRVAASLAHLKKCHSCEEYELWLERAAGLHVVNNFENYDFSDIK